jgi:hypothetical protein
MIRRGGFSTRECRFSVPQPRTREIFGVEEGDFFFSVDFLPRTQVQRNDSAACEPGLALRARLKPAPAGKGTSVGALSRAKFLERAGNNVQVGEHKDLTSRKRTSKRQFDFPCGWVCAPLTFISVALTDLH